MYLEIPSDAGLSDDDLRSRLAQCLSERCVLCDGPSFMSLNRLASMDVQRLMGTPAGYVGVIQIPLCQRCSVERRAQAVEALLRAIAEVAQANGEIFVRI